MKQSSSENHQQKTMLKLMSLILTTSNDDKKWFVKGPVIIYVGGWGGEIMGWARPIFFREKGWVIVCVL